MCWVFGLIFAVKIRFLYVGYTNASYLLIYMAKKALLSNYMVTSSYACKESESLELYLSLMHATDML